MACLGAIRFAVPEIVQDEILHIWEFHPDVSDPYIIRGLGCDREVPVECTAPYHGLVALDVHIYVSTQVLHRCELEEYVPGPGDLDLDIDVSGLDSFSALNRVDASQDIREESEFGIFGGAQGEVDQDTAWFAEFQITGDAWGIGIGGIRKF